MTRNTVTTVSVAALLLAAACSDGQAGSGRVPSEIRLLTPFTQSGTPGWPLRDSVVVEVLDAEGDAVPGVPVTWTAANGADVIGRPADTTNLSGRAAAEWTLGRTEGQQTLSVRAGALAPVTVSATATIFHASIVSTGNAFACALAAGETFCWGTNFAGQLGSGALGDSARAPVPVAGSATFASLSVGGAHVCGLTADGIAYCWGSNASGETGTGAVSQSVPVPTPVQTTLRFTQISAEGVGPFANSTCGLSNAGEVWCWGDNSFAKLGDGTTTSSAVPVRVQSNLTFSAVHTGFFHSCAMSTAGELWCWGEQETDTGAFGERPAGLYATPIPVQESFRFVEISAGRNYTCGLTGDHAAFCWGADWFGSLGNGASETLIPLPVIGGHSFATIRAPSFEENHALTTDGELYRWGSPGGDVVQSSPVAVTDLRFLQVDSGEDPFGGGNAACGIAEGQTVYCARDDGLVRGVRLRRAHELSAWVWSQ